MTSLFCIAMAVFFEGRNQSITGQEAIANVIMNRVESHRWPDTPCEVVLQPKQFSFTHDILSDDYRTYGTNVFEVRAIAIAEAVSQSALENNLLGLTSTHYHTKEVLPYWSSYYLQDGILGDHIFYTAPEGK
jgi:spore germination cell wall hydrolase CwlJ-like protein